MVEMETASSKWHVKGIYIPGKKSASLGLFSKKFCKHQYNPSLQP